VYLARAATPYSESYADLDLPATPYELLDTLDKLRLSEGETPYLQINEYYNFEELAPLLSGDSGLYELNALAKRLSELDELQQASFEGMLQMEVNKKEGQIQMPRLIVLAYGTGCCHVVDATNDSQLVNFTPKTALCRRWMTFPTSSLICWILSESVGSFARTRAAYLLSVVMWCGTASRRRCSICLTSRQNSPTIRCYFGLRMAMR
jgi:hypothetical protein